MRTTSFDVRSSGGDQRVVGRGGLEPPTVPVFSLTIAISPASVVATTTKPCWRDGTTIGEPSSSSPA